MQGPLRSIFPVAYPNSCSALCLGNKIPELIGHNRDLPGSRISWNFADSLNGS
ncbi:hypothetical protein PISMIDRAFT_674875 [Pisolithus microcarpus 441]|uniref:Uncharacterized protein n=1 Tax=Pisolithus microcarpus 441 TaxID=765257 RepID=A0A0D0A654_9AGAM|nr:hypothetical protein PISMIDRAFT_674875 [Pisolithus microcarpus 441]